MKVLFDINHPAHAHFFGGPIRLLQADGWDVVVTSRDKEMTCALLESAGVRHRCLSSAARGGGFALGMELLKRDYKLWSVVRQERPMVMASIGGTFIAHVGALTRVPSLVFYDTENARLQNAITYPFVTRLCVPDCYQSWTPRGRTLRYSGYHELAYLHPKRFTPNRGIAEANGTDPQRQNFMIRLVAWNANHDIAEKGLTDDLVRAVVHRLAQHGKVMISSERPLPDDLQAFAYAGARDQIHHVIAHASAYFGESATMASEAAVLGVPAVYAANTGRGYTDEQESRFGLVRNIRSLKLDAIEAALEWQLSGTRAQWQERRAKLLAETIDVTAYVVKQIQELARVDLAHPAQPKRLPR